MGVRRPLGRTGLTAGAVALLLGLAPVGCYDSPLGPGRVIPPAPSGLKVTPSALVSSTSSDGSTVTIVDEDDGTEYTLHVAQRQLWRGSESVPLTVEQTEMLAAAYRGTVALDPAADELATMEPPPCMDTPEDPCPQDQFTSSATTESDTYPMSVRRSLPDGSYETLLTGSGQEQAATATASSGTTSAYYGYYGDVCTDVANAALSTVNNYRGVRSRLGSDVWQAIKDEILGQAGRAAEVMSVVADHYYARVAVGVLAMYWNAYNCSSRQITAGTV